MPFAHQASDDVHIASKEDWQLCFPMNEMQAQELSAHGPLVLKAGALKQCGLSIFAISLELITDITEF